MGGGGERLDDGENIARTEPCGFVVAGAGLGARFCDKPALSGGSYCAEHAALCVARPGSRAARRRLLSLRRAAGEAPPAELGALPPEAEPLEPTEAHEVLDALALPEHEEDAR
jgi:hypothetical protein